MVHLTEMSALYLLSALFRAKLLTEQMMTQFTDAYIHHTGPLLLTLFNLIPSMDK